MKDDQKQVLCKKYMQYLPSHRDFKYVLDGQVKVNLKALAILLDYLNDVMHTEFLGCSYTQRELEEAYEKVFEAYAKAIEGRVWNIVPSAENHQGLSGLKIKNCFNAKTDTVSLGNC